jgi:hypothetical protein
MNTTDTSEPVLGADFAARVLDQADRIRNRRKRIRRMMGGLAAASGVSFAVAWMVFAGAPQRQRPEPATLPAARVVAVAETGEADALDDFFPDAASVARFAAQYSDETNDEGQDADPLSEEDPSSP